VRLIKAAIVGVLVLVMFATPAFAYRCRGFTREIVRTEGSLENGQTISLDVNVGVWTE